MNKGVTADWASPGQLRAAWKRVKRNKGQAGADRLTIPEFDRDSACRIAALSEALRCGDYRPVRHFVIRKTKESGGTRLIRIPSVTDRIAQAACGRDLAQRYDRKMGNASFAFRNGMSVQHAAGRIARLRLQGWTFGLRTDIRDFFDDIPHRVLMEALTPGLPCVGTGHVIRLWLRMASRRGRGIGQGSPLSPVLANIYLIPFDQALDRGRFRLIRYADDILVLCKHPRSIDPAERCVAAALRDLGLRANPDKTEAVSFASGFGFLGMHFVGDRIGRGEPEPAGPTVI